jgi:hypothetical protein
MECLAINTNFDCLPIEGCEYVTRSRAPPLIVLCEVVTMKWTCHTNPH